MRRNSRAKVVRFCDNVQWFFCFVLGFCFGFFFPLCGSSEQRDSQNLLPLHTKWDVLGSEIWE